MILFDELMILRAIEEEDAPILQQMINDPEIENAVVGFSYPVSLTSQKKWIANLSQDNTVRYAIEVENRVVGVISVSSIDLKNRVGNINIKLISEARGKGYAMRASKMVIEYCFQELNLNCITANVIERNCDSKKLWEKLGFSIDGILRQRVYKNGKYHNLVSYSLLKEEYDERNRK